MILSFIPEKYRTKSLKQFRTLTITGLAAMAMTLVQVPTAGATATFFAGAIGELTLVTATSNGENFTIFGSVDAPLVDVVQFGDGMGDATPFAFADPLIEAGNDQGLFLSAEASGTTTTNGLWDALVLTSGAIDIDNTNNANDLVLEFNLFYDLSVLASADNILTEGAFGDAFVDLFLNGAPFLSFDVFASSDIGPPIDTLFADQLFSVTVGAGQVADLELFVDVSGFADSNNNVVPEPSTALLFALAGGALLVTRRRKKR